MFEIKNNAKSVKFCEIFGGVLCDYENYAFLVDKTHHLLLLNPT